ncbi:lysylphosphatidylglycerol synthase transmembrane domain-containing protein [Pseudofrankia sp. BMG5.37]|uniref:lysylphosphatidylglycerol synthase transmembrane domain-containing protein n=1 Tax=Pseudofrankia sp. BMG5.37 TaxID=3050035 RepID=UPI00289460B1|nr:lysylphosphatidylglycerol synthase transmembrane domain-containing protein [Pseudofrankia sp. BMG5.37]MDT3438220.1 lysylphosphatidylglycerol synthase transmembrane domain-containing protein [Pseudofrankia sp. BMG5.37]
MSEPAEREDAPAPASATILLESSSPETQPPESPSSEVQLLEVQLLEVQLSEVQLPETPPSGTELPETTPASSPSAARSRRSRRIMAALSIVAPAVGATWLGTHHEELRAAFLACKRADGEWLLVAVVAACATYFAAAASMKGAVTRKLPFGQLLAIQIAAILPNVLVPAGMGVAALQTRYLLRRGLTMAEAVASTAANATAGAIPHALMFVVLLFAGAVPLPHLAFGGSTRYFVVATVAAAFVAACVPKVRRAVGLGVRRLVEHRDLLAGSGSTRRAVLLWGGSIAIPMLHAATLCAIAAALHAPLGPGKIIVVYLVASALSAVIPSPGGFGGLDAALTALLTGAGVPTATAIAAVLGYRLLTAWLPLAPSAAVCGVLIRTRVI